MFDSGNRDRTRAAILREYRLPRKELAKHLLKVLDKYSRMIAEPAHNPDWESVFAGEWNRYDLQKSDLTTMKRWISSGKVQLKEFALVVSDETWHWLACLAYLDAKPKESPNHVFLKELLRLYIQKVHNTKTIQKEHRDTIFTERVRYDLYLDNEKIIGEVGGVQLWKVMGALEKGYTVYLLPHWTDDKVRPFAKKVTRFRLYKLVKKEEQQ